MSWVNWQKKARGAVCSGQQNIPSGYQDGFKITIYTVWHIDFKHTMYSHWKKKQSGWKFIRRLPFSQYC